MKAKWFKLCAVVLGGATLFQNGCLTDFWDGFFNSGWPADVRWLNIAIDVLNEELFG